MSDAPRLVDRFRVAAAPEGLLLVQELLNTAGIKANASFPDLLATPEHARAWMQAIGVPGPVDAAALRLLRDGLRAALVYRDEGGEVPSDADDLLETTILFRLSPDGSVRTAASGVREDVLLAVRDAQLTGTWPRLKVCRNPECRVAFWDLSRNTSAVWHDSRTCGNTANLRASRARRKVQGTAL